MSGGSWRRYFEKRSIWTVIYTIYIVLILLSVHALIAQNSVDDIQSKMDKEYNYDLVFEKDGESSHYIVTRHNSDSNGRITLTYWTDDNKLDITRVKNIKTLEIDVKSMFEDEAKKVFKKNPTQIPGMDLAYWLEAGDGIFTIDFDISSDEPLQSLTFSKFPTPKSVTVNNQEWWKTKTQYTTSGKKITITNIPTGKTQVILYFKLANQLPTAAFTTNPVQFAGVKENVVFDGSGSSDPDGDITSWVWDFGDGNGNSGESVSYKYNKPGTYTIRLTVRDDAEPFGEDWIEKSLTVAYGAEDDFDFDGLRDAWEWKYFNSTDEDGDGDFDQDDFTNKEEYDADTDPTNPYSKPREDAGGKKAPGQDMGMIGLIIAVIVVVVVLLVVMMILKSKKGKERNQDKEAIAEMEAKIERARKLGLPTGELERMLKEAKEGKPLSVKTVKEKKGPSRRKGKGRR